MTIRHAEFYSFAIVLLLLCSMHFFAARAALAGHLTAPEHNISMAFDLENSSLSANSRIDLPAGVSLHLDLSHLLVSQVIINGQAAQPDQDSPDLEIPAAAHDQEILIAYSRQFPPGATQYSMISESGITLSEPWYPVADHEMLFKLTAQIPPAFTAVSEADEIISFSMNDKKQVTFRFPHPLHSINFVAGPYSVMEESFGEGKTLAAYFFPEDKELGASYLEKVRQYLQRYEKMLGPYPYQRFSVVENRLPTGFAMPTFTLLGQAVVRLPFIVDTSLGHEVLHAWFGNGVRMSLQEGNWVEGLTTYLADQSFAADKGDDSLYRKTQLVKYQSYVRPDMKLDLRNFNNVGHDDSKAEPVRGVGYNKSSMFFHMLRNKVGPEVFAGALRDFYKRLQYKTGGWSDLQTSFESIAGIPLGDFFKQWLDRSDVPVLGVEKAEIDNSAGYPVIHFDIVQENSTPYVLDVPVVITTAGEEIRKMLSIAAPRSTFEIPLAALPETLVIDPGYDLMRTLAPAELPPTWSSYLGAAKAIAILPSEQHRALYQSLLEQLADREGLILLQDEVTDADLATNSLLFLGTDGKLSRSLFAAPDHPVGGFTVDVRNNPLNPGQVAVLVSAADAAEVQKGAVKLRHYGKYSYLSFRDGRIQEKRVAETDAGIRIDLVSLPGGIETSRAKSFDDMIGKLLPYQVIYIGEGHTNYEDHLLQLEIIRALYAHDQRLAIGMEMFTRANQPVIDRYLAGELDEKSFLKESHYFKTWRFDYRLYRDIINFAKHNHLPLIGLNLEKEIVSQVFKSGGAGSLSAEEADLLPQDRKLDETGYRERLEIAYMMHGRQEGNGEFSGFLQAQAVWDETMAETIAAYLEKHPDERMVIIAGRGHVDRTNAIPPRVARRLPVSQAVAANSNGAVDESASADFIFFSPPESLSPAPLLGVMLEDREGAEGVLVTALNPQGQAKDAGIREKDIILAIDGEPVNDVEDVKIVMLYKEKSDSVTVRIKRPQFLFGDKAMELKVNMKSAAAAHPM